ncbi:hydroxypyruvate isomerase [Pseudoxanthomonas winnipegensis]|uniref:Hydroxypyruvate isomerase n=2 Tax=Pseudoxanthomonas winnipegensis TaxID=2480810 RepID=A0A4Q8LL25_9GAMM|nr:hydroxypyruvate isomerase [Pseudoxanthomonas winnipegensis]TAA31214.1 hydroxypyruvate isomerase [Pseudoxanthomonas winnipegensis]TAA38395.1 hydroxypyruvate isomerase [Pseudoxanthomonas winnipegensis]TBV77483.1 hydroxypyruvate isomerase [Pseudoxanthomonas winnipegensis]
MNSGPTRRDLLRMGVLGGVGLASSALLPAWAAVPATAPSAPKGRLKQSVARWLFQQPIDQLCVTVKQVGLSAIDLVGPEEWPMLKAHGIDSPMCNGAEISLKQGFAGTEFHDELVARYTRHIDLVADAGYRNLICFSGNRNGMDPVQGMRNAEVGLKRVLGHAEKRGVVLVMELLNSRVDHADYLCDHSAWGVELCKRIGSPNFGLLFDIYHMQIMEGDIIASIRRNHEYFVHYHTAGVPGRHELDDTQELNYAAICRAIRDTGFGGYVAHEFSAAHTDPIDALRQAIALCDV